MITRAPLLLRGGGALGVALALLAVVPVGSAAAAPATVVRSVAVRSAVAGATAAGCTDVLVVGIDGNGEHPRSGRRFGPTLDTLTRSYVSSLSGTRSVRVQRIAGRMPALSTLTSGARRHKTAGAAIRTAAVRRWARPVGATVNRATPWITASLRRCPAQQLVLAGYAQGASVAHRILLRIARQGLLGQVTAAVLVSDPDRRRGTRATRDGDPVAPRARRGIISLRLGGVADVPARRGTYASWEICAAHDLVCDPSATSVSRAASIARSYAGGGHVDGAIKRIRSTLSSRTRWWPVPSPTRRVVAATEGRPVRVQLAAAAVAAVQHGLRWQAVGALPAGLSLSATGLLTGTAPAPGVRTITYTVAGTTPRTPARTGTLVLTIAGRVVGVSSGGQTSCETRTDHTVWCWGRNDYGQLGIGTTTSSATPRQLPGDDWAQVSTSGSTTCGVRTDHTLYCWGLNDYDQTGRTQTETGGAAPVTKPLKVGTSAAWKQVAVGWSHACGVRTDGQLYCWGQNLRGQLGLGTTGAAKPTPQRVGTGSTWTSVVSGGWHSCAIRTDGTAWCWGDNALGGLGIGTTTTQPSPAQVGAATDWRSLSASFGGTCGIRGSGDLYCWGKNRSGEVGDATTTDRTAPVKVSGSGWLAVAAGDGSTCALDATGRPWCWGDNRYQQASTGAVSRAATPARRGTATGLTAIAAGWLHYCAVGSDVSCWGSNEVGQLGTAAVTAKATPATTAIPAPEQQRLDAMGPAQVAQHDLGDRPAVSAAAQAATAPTSVRVMTYNVLGSNHTKPGGDAAEYAPARLRTEWESAIIAADSSGLVGTQEAQPDQIADFGQALGGAYTIYPGSAQGYDATPQSLMFRTSAWTRVWQDSISIPFESGWRPQPVVRLKNKATGAQLYFVNVHFTPGSATARHNDRVKAMDVLVAEITTLEKDKLPIVLTGDFNEKDWVYCQITSRTDLRAASGGTNVGGKCTPPSSERVDWIFGTGGSWSAYSLGDGPEIQRTSDHAVQLSTLTLGG